MSSQRSFDLALHQKDEPKTASAEPEANKSSDSIPQDQHAVQSPFAVTGGSRVPSPETDARDPHPAQSAPDVATTPASTDITSGTRDPQPTQSAPSPQVTVTSPTEEAPVTSPAKSKSKGIQFSNYITHISDQGDQKFIPWNTSQTKLPLGSLISEHHQPSPSSATQQSTQDLPASSVSKQTIPDRLPSSTTEQSNPERPSSSATEQKSESLSSSGSEQNPDLCTFAEYLKDESNLPKPTQSVSSLNDASPSGLKRSVSKRVAHKIHSLVAPRSKRPDTPLSFTTTSILPTEEQKEDEQEAQSKKEAQTSITNIGQSGTLPPSHQPLTTTTSFPPLPSLNRARLAPPTTTEAPPHTRGRSPTVTIRPDYELIEPHLARARMSKNETHIAGQPLTSIATMSASEPSTTGPQPIPLECPAWDRRVDLTWTRDDTISWDGARELTAFRVSLAQFHREAKRTPSANDLLNPLFQLPDKVRYMICKYLVPDHPSSKPIKLNNGQRLAEPVWLVVHFDTLANVLSCVRDYTAVCWAMRADVLVTILNIRAFHVVFSPFSGPLLDPLAFEWFGKHAGYIQRLTIELDMTKLGFGQAPGAASISPLVKKKLLPRVEEYVVAVKRRGIFQDLMMNPRARFFGEEEADKAKKGGGGVSTVHSLTVAVRRYYGERPAETGQVPQKYAPDEYLAVLGPMKALRGKVDILRAVGLDPDSTHRLLVLVQPAAGGGPVEGSPGGATDGRLGTVSSRCPSDFYPPLPGQASFFTDGETGKGVFVRHPFALIDARVGLYLDENMVAKARKGTDAVHSVVGALPGAGGAPVLGGRGEPAVKRSRAFSGLVSGRGEKEKGKGKAVEREEAPEWPQEPEEETKKTEEKKGTERESRGSSMEMEPFPELLDEELQLALLAAYELNQGVGALVERCPSPERQQGEAAEESMPGRSSRSSRSSSGAGGVVGRVADRLQKGMSQLNLKGGASSKE